MVYTTLALQGATAAATAAASAVGNSSAMFAADPSTFEQGASEYVYGAPPITQAGARGPNFRMARLFSESSEIKISVAPESTDGPGSADGVGAPPSSGSGDDGDGGTKKKRGHDFEHYGLKVYRHKISGTVLLEPKGAAAIPLLLNAIRDENSWCWGEAFEMIRKMGEEAADAVMPLVNLAKDPNYNETIRVHALYALADFKEVAAPAVDALIEMALHTESDTEHWGISKIAMLTLGRIGAKAKKALPMLRKVVKTESDRLRLGYAKKAVQRISDGLKEERLRAKAAEDGHLVIKFRTTGGLENSLYNMRDLKDLKKVIRRYLKRGFWGDEYSIVKTRILSEAAFLVVTPNDPRKVLKLFRKIESDQTASIAWTAARLAIHSIQFDKRMSGDFGNRGRE